MVDILICESIRGKNGSLEDERGSKVLYYSSLANSLNALNKEESNNLTFDSFCEHFNHLHEYTADTIENLAEFLSHVISENHLVFPWSKVAPNAASKQEVARSVNPSILFWRDLIHRLC